MDPLAERKGIIDQASGEDGAADDESEGEDEGTKAQRLAGADLRTALAGDDDLEVFKAFDHCLKVRDLAKEDGPKDEPEGDGKKSALVIAIGKARPPKKE